MLLERDYSMRFCFAIVMLCSIGWSAAPTHGATLVADGKAAAAVVIPADATNQEKLAAAELVDHLEKIAGVKLEVTHTEPASGTAVVRLGRAAPVQLEQLIQSRGDDPSAFALIIGDQDIAIRGQTDLGTAFGVYELLERLGVRWFMPGELGTVIPQLKTVALEPVEVVQVPSFKARIHGGFTLNPRNEEQFWGMRMRKSGPYFPSAHGILGVHGLPRDEKRIKALFDEHPEYFSLVNGERRLLQLCVSNHDLVKLVIERTKTYFREHPEQPWIGMGARDGANFCECANCRALDNGKWDSYLNDWVVTDRYIWFFNQVLKGIEDEFPDKKLCFYAYVNYRTPPTKFKPDPRIIPAIAPIVPCRTHGPGSSVCPEGATYYEPLLKGWSELVPEVYDRGFWYNLADPGLPFPMVHRLRKQIPMARKYNIVGWRVQTHTSWAAYGPSLYVASKLLWDHTADVDALVHDYCNGLFGPAAEPMYQYLTMMDDAIANSDHHAGTCYDTNQHFPAELRQRGRTLLHEAAALARPADSLYAQRVEIFAKEQVLLDSFLTMRASRQRFDFATSKAALQVVDRMIEDLGAYEPEMIYARFSREYMRRFFRLQTEQGYARTTGGNELVAPLKAEWSFLTDPGHLGMDLNYWDAQMTGGSWQSISSSLSWSNQGLHYYKGEAWYRQAVRIDEKWEGKRIFLWSAGVDEKAQVFVNGKEIGISHGSAFMPFELDATEAVRPGADNVVVFRINNERVDEIGTGGIIGPVMFYAPAAGADAQLENVRAPGRTFP